MATTEQHDDWLELTPAAAVAAVNRVTLHRAAVRGEITFATVAGRRVFHREDLRQWARAREAK